jgi:DNA-binding MarR family transcriptional regulator
MKTDEDRGQYATEQEDSLNNARAMMGWDDPPSVVVEPPRKITVRRGKKMVEHDEPAWVKFSTDFKSELISLDEYSLKVFIYIGLSVGFETGTAYPGVRLIAKETGMNKDTVQKCIADLEENGFMEVYRREGNSNIYKPTRFISIGTVPPDRTPNAELSGQKHELSGENAELSGAQEGNLHNKNNKKEQEKHVATPLSSFELEEIKTSANKTVDGILEGERIAQEKENVGQGWRGRELTPPQYLIYGDWWHSKTKQHMYGAKGKAKINTEWLKAFKEFYENDVAISVLDETYDAEIAWKKIISKPSELISKAIAIQALPAAKDTTTEIRNPFEALLNYVQEGSAA